MKYRRQTLTKRQMQLLDFIIERRDICGYPPTFREIGAAMGIKSSNGVSDHMKALERKGYISREHGTPRGITVIDRDGFSPEEWRGRALQAERIVEAVEQQWAGTFVAVVSLLTTGATLR